MPNDFDDRDDYDDRAVRRRSRDEYPPEPQVSVLGIFALVQGVVSVLVSLIPCVGAFGIVGGVFGLLLGVIALAVAKRSNGRIGFGVPVAAVSLNLGGMIIAGLWIALLSGAFSPAKKDAPGVELVDGAGNRVPVVSAVALHDEFRDDADARTRYEGRWIMVTGAAVLVGAERRPNPVMELGEGDATVSCVFAAEKGDELAAVAAGQRVIVQGRCRGKVQGRVTLEDCVLHTREPQKAAPQEKAGPPVRVTAEELLKAFDENVVAADEKYTNSVLDVSGRVQKVFRGDPLKTTLQLRTGDENGGAIVHCDFLAKDAAPLGSLKPGQEVVVRGTCLGQPDPAGPVTLERCEVVK